jgi:hypothetical protein
LQAKYKTGAVFTAGGYFDTGAVLAAGGYSKTGAVLAAGGYSKTGAVLAAGGYSKTGAVLAAGGYSKTGSVLAHSLCSNAVNCTAMLSHYTVALCYYIVTHCAAPLYCSIMPLLSYEGHNIIRMLC